MAEDTLDFEKSDRWVPSFGVVMGFTYQDQKGSVSSETIGDPNNPPRPPNDNNALNQSPIAGGRLELISPTFEVPLQPRIFFNGEINFLANQNREVAREGSPTGIDQPDVPAFPVQAITGVGSVTNSDARNVEYGAGVGIFIPFQVGDWSFAIKPSARYLRRHLNFDGFVIAARRPNPFGPTQEIFIQGKDHLDINALGPFLELEVDVAHWWTSVGASVFIEGGAFRILSDHDVEFSGNTSAPNPTTGAPQFFRATWTADVDPWIYRGSIGVRLRWGGMRSGWLGMGSRTD
jgi:hypothetical protein